MVSADGTVDGVAVNKGIDSPSRGHVVPRCPPHVKLALIDQAAGRTAPKHGSGTSCKVAQLVRADVLLGATVAEVPARVSCGPLSG